MSIECENCKTTSATVSFRTPLVYPRDVRITRYLLIAAATIAIWNAGEALFNVSNLVEAANSADKFVRDFPGQTYEEEQINDVFRFFSNVVYYIIVVLTVILIYLPIRFLVLLLRFRTGRPPTHWQTKSVALQAIGVSLLLLFTWAAVYSNLQTVYIAPPVGLNLFVGPALLFYLNKPIVKTYFNQFKWKALVTQLPSPSPTPGWAPAAGLAAVSWIPEQVAPSHNPGWEPVPEPVDDVERPVRLQCPSCWGVIEALRSAGTVRCPTVGCGYTAPFPI